MLNRSQDTFAETMSSRDEGSLVLMGSVLRAVQAEQLLSNEGYEVRLVVPPVELRTGCDLALACSAHVVVGVTQALEAYDLVPVRVIDTLHGTSVITELVTREYYDQSGVIVEEPIARYLMVRAGNMKLTVDLTTGVIVNTSGGGCPDVPYLNSNMVGCHLNEAPRPKTLGKTLCGLMLDTAFLRASEDYQAGLDTTIDEESNESL